MKKLSRALGTLVGAMVVSAALVACDPTPPPSFTVDTGTVEPDANPGDGICASTAASGGCTLRAAIEEANALGRAEIHVAVTSINLYSPALSVTGDLTMTSPNASGFRASIVVEEGATLRLAGMKAAHQAGLVGLPSYGTIVVRGTAVLEQVHACVEVEESGVLVAQNSFVLNFANDGIAHLRHVTATGTPPVIASGPDSATYISSSLLYQPTFFFPTLQPCSGPPPISGGYNLTNTTCGLDGPGDIENANVGTPYQLNAETPGGVAIDHIPVGVNGCGTEVTVDVYGLARPVARTSETPACDVGAMEVPAP